MVLSGLDVPIPTLLEASTTKPMSVPPPAANPRNSAAPALN